MKCLYTFKASVTYHAETYFGKTADNAQNLVRTIGGKMVKCWYGGPESLWRAMPVSNLSSRFLIEQSCPTLDITNGHKSGKVITIMANGHGIN